MSEFPFKHPDAPPPANVTVLRPDGVFIRPEGHTHYVERRRGGRSVAAVSYDLGELYELRSALNRYLAEFER